MTAFFEKSYNNTRTKKERVPLVPSLFWRSRWDSKERPDRREGKKVSGGHFLSSWESPSDLRRIRYEYKEL